VSAGAVVVHASTVAFGPDGGVMIEGPSGSGKSGLALRLIDLGAELVADDRTLLFARGDALYARAPRPIAGLIEARGLGILRLAARRLAQVRLVVDLGDGGAAPRLPAPQSCQRLGRTVPRLAARPGAGLATALARLMRHWTAAPGGADGLLLAGPLPGRP